jgi:hypothetical protein
MRLTLNLLLQTPTSTLSALLVGVDFECFVLEDGYNKTKVYGKTRIPGGLYEITQRREGEKFLQMKRKFGHTFIPYLNNVPGYEWILIHILNTVEETLGCLGVGDGARFVNSKKVFTLTDSTVAYLRLYAKLAAAFKRGDRVFIQINRESDSLKILQTIVNPLGLA